MPDWTLHHGDALTILPTLTTPIDAVIADPPYNSGGRTMTERTSRTAREKYLTSGGREHGFDSGTSPATIVTNAATSPGCR